MEDNIKKIEEQEFVNVENMQDIKEVLDNVSSSEFEFVKDICNIDDNELEKIMHEDEFKNGFKIGIELAGVYTALLNFGVDIKTTSDAVINYQTLKHNLELQKIVNEGAKYQNEVLKSQSL